MSAWGKVSESGMDSNSIELISKDGKGNFLVRHSKTGNICYVADTFAEVFSTWSGRVLITADSEKWASMAAKSATGFATSIIMSPAESGEEGRVAPDKTPDGRVGVLIQIHNRDRFELKSQMILRISQCVMTCPTTSAFDAMPDAKRRLKVGRSIRLFGDGFQRKGLVGGRKVWKIPVMEGDFIIEDTFGVSPAIAGGNLLILAKDRSSGLRASEEAVEAIRKDACGVILPFPGGICRSGSKAGSLKYKLRASTNHVFCPGLRELVTNSQLPENARCVYEIVIDGLSVSAVRNAMEKGITAAAAVQDVIGITAGNYGGRLGQDKISLKDILQL